MYFINRHHKIFYRSSIISFCLVFLAISICQADADIKRLELASRINETENPKSGRMCQTGRDVYKKIAKGLAGDASQKQQLLQVIKRSLKIKNLLYKHFGKKLINDISIHWNVADLPRRWGNIQGNYSIRLKGKDKQAQAYGKHIYIASSKIGVRDSEFADIFDFLPVLTHQLVHVQQQLKYPEERKALSQFGCDFFDGYYKDAKEIYENNPMEKKAEEKSQEILAELGRVASSDSNK